MMTAVAVNERRVGVSVGVGAVCNYSLRYVTDEEQLPEVVEWLRTLKAVGLDLETSAIKPHDGNMATLQLGFPFGEDPRAYVIDVRCVSADSLRPIFDVLEDNETVIVGQNLKFEAAWLLKHYGVKIRNCQDTQVTELVLRAGLFEAKSKYNKARGERAAYKWCSMASLTQRYLSQDIDKDHDLRTSFYKTPPGQHSERQLAYAAGDVIYPFYILKAQWPIVRSRTLTNIMKIEYQLIPILAEAEVKGLLIDTAAWTDLWQESVRELKLVKDKLDDLARPLTVQSDLFQAQETTRPIYPKLNVPLNYKSGDHKLWLIKAYCESIGWKHKVVIDQKEINKLKLSYGEQYLDQLTRNGREATPDKVPDYMVPEHEYCLLPDTESKTMLLRMLRGQLPVELVRLLMDFSMYEKRVSTYGIKFLQKHVDPRGVLRTEFHQAIPATGRLSTEPNVQNWPRDARYRKCLIAPKGYKLVIMDASQIEPRISAYVSGDPTYTQAFLTNDDLYLSIAESMFGFRPDKSTEEGTLLRHIAKTIVLALAYRLGVVKLRDHLTIALKDYILAGKREPPTIPETRDLWNKFFEACPGIKPFQEMCSNQADPKKTNRPKLWDEMLKAEVTYVQAPCGRIRFFPPDAMDTYTTGPNVPPQSTSATMIKLAAVKVQEYIDKHDVDAYMVNSVHDELVWAVETSRAQNFAYAAKRIMEESGHAIIPTIPVKVEFPEGTEGVLDYWAKAVKTIEEDS